MATNYLRTVLVLIPVIFSAGHAGAEKSVNACAGLPGIDVTDPFPAGCVDCHIKLPDRDVRIGSLLAKVDHPKIIRPVVTVPDDCLECHSQQGEGETLSTLLHRTHYGKGPNSHFVQEFGGLCLHCHAIARESGEVRVKHGPTNW